MSCPPNMLCINYSYTIIFIIVTGLFLFYLYTKYQHIFIENSELKQNVNQKINILSKKVEHNQIQQQQQNKNNLYEEIRSKLNETPQNNDIFDEPRKTTDGVRVNISTRGPIPKISQIGILSKMTHTNDTGPGSDAEAHILPLLGRRTYNRSNKWVYYTATDKYNQVRIPISHNGRNCGGEYGCDEIMNGDTIIIPELNGSFVAKIYENTSLHYIPY
tara:strand:+ start:817 stop:1467 length:651 start_codon:yes stop_codon:yes gene_type:complete